MAFLVGSIGVACQSVAHEDPVPSGPLDEPPVLQRAFEVLYDSFERDVRFEGFPRGSGFGNRTVELTFNRAALRGAVTPWEETTLFFDLLVEAVDDDTFIEEPRLDGRGLRLGFEAQPRLSGRVRGDLGASGAWITADETAWRQSLEMRYAELYAQLGVGWDLIDSTDDGLDGPGRVTARAGGYFDGIAGRYRLDTPGPFAVRDDLTTGGVGLYLALDVWSYPLFLRGIAWFGEREGIGLVAGWTF